MWEYVKRELVLLWCKSRVWLKLVILFMVPLILLLSSFIIASSSSSSHRHISFNSSTSVGNSSSRGETSIKDFDVVAGQISDNIRKEEAASDEVEFKLTPFAFPPLSQPPLAALEDEISNNATFHISPILNSNDSHIQPSLNTSDALPKSVIKRNNHSLDHIEVSLGRARAAIRLAKTKNQTNDPDYVPTGPIYRNAAAFHRSYLEMERLFKVYVYQEGELPVFHNGPCKNIYSMEGTFIYQMENSQFRTRDPDKAHVYFLPMSIGAIVHFLFDEGDPHNWQPMRLTVKDYVGVLAGKYPYWNRSAGADHFMLSCHDWGPALSRVVPNLFRNSIRALCNANTSEGFKPTKDVSIPEINVPSGTIDGLIGGPTPSRRPILAFFAGRLHGPIRPILVDQWENKDPDIQVHKYLPKGVSYYAMLRKTKFCICPSGYEVASPRMVEALYTGCVPVLVKDHYVAPFSDVLNWKSFSVEVPVDDIPNLKKILMGISPRQYIRMQRRGKQVMRHFLLSWPPKRYDVFHMILHSVWLRRLNVQVQGVVI